MIVHVAAPNTFAQDGRPACATHLSNKRNVTHTLAEVTCKNCLRSSHYRYAVAQGWKESDQEGVKVRLHGRGSS